LKIKRLAAAAAPVGAAVLATSYVAAPPAQAAPASKGAILCSGDLCIQTDGLEPSGDACVETWANDQTFYGHFEISTSDGQFVENTANESWKAGGTGSEFWSVPYFSPPVIARAWEYNKSTKKYNRIGKVSFGVDQAGLNSC
jgi:hypothetical protein